MPVYRVASRPVHADGRQTGFEMVIFFFPSTILRVKRPETHLIGIKHFIFILPSVPGFEILAADKSTEMCGLYLTNSGLSLFDRS